MKIKNDDEIFLNFLYKEKELSSIVKIHEDTIVEFIDRCLEEKFEQSSFLKKMIWIMKSIFIKINNWFCYQHNNLSNINYERIINHKEFIKKSFKIHYTFVEKLKEKIFTNDDSKNDFEYTVYLNIEHNEIITQKYFFKVFINKNEAESYYNNLIDKYKNKNIYTLFKELTTIIDSRYNELDDRINKFSINNR